jgi:adenylate kinase
MRDPRFRSGVASSVGALARVGDRPTESAIGSLRLAFIGGASGVGKSTVLGMLPDELKFNTGTLFKEHMALEDRDDVRKKVWSNFEDAVAADLVHIVGQALDRHGVAIVDTHFSAQHHGREYRIGMRQNLIHWIGHELFARAADRGILVSAKVILVKCDVNSLLRRRRLDTARKRPLVPADCFNALRANDTCSHEYFRELVRAAKGSEHTVQYFTVENEDLALSRPALHRALG